MAATFPFVAWLYTTACNAFISGGCKGSNAERTSGKFAVLERMASRSDIPYIKATPNTKEAARKIRSLIHTEGEMLTESAQENLSGDTNRQLLAWIGKLLGHVGNAVEPHISLHPHSTKSAERAYRACQSEIQRWCQLVTTARSSLKNAPQRPH